MRIAIIGSGYVGLVTGACLADFGHDVICVDTDEKRIEALRRGEVPIFEPGLPELVASNAGAKRLAFTTDLAQAVGRSRVILIAVGTPALSDGRVNLSFVEAAARAVANSVEGFTVAAIKSTVPVGTGDEVERIVREANPGADVAVVSNPEFLREGSAIAEFRLPNRIIVGLEDERAREPMTEVYRPLYLNRAPLMFTGRRTAELIKYAANAFLALKISYINEIADLCERVGVDVQDVATGIGLDNRIGTKFLHAGPGYGGSCLPKDTAALAGLARAHGVPLRLVDSTLLVNESRKTGMAGKIVAACGGSVRGKTVAVLGLTFKPNTDDMREAPSLAIIGGLQQAGATIRAYDPAGMDAARAATQSVYFAADAYDAAAGADALILVTEWAEFRALDFERLKATMSNPLLVDLRNIYARSEVVRATFTYVGVGTPGSWPARPGPIAVS
jgi:UDPglucose 6-dehydrogenase